MENNDIDIEDLDWRIRACSSLAKPYRDPITGTIHPIGTILKVIKEIIYKDNIQHITLPNPTAMYLSLATKLGNHGYDFIKNNFPNNKEIISQKDENLFNTKLFDAFENLIACVIFSYSAIEAFANFEIPKEYIFKIERKDKRCQEIYNHAQIERFLNLEMKLKIILPDILQTKSKIPNKIWQDYLWLKKIRNRFVHLKHSDWDNKPVDKKKLYTGLWYDLLSEKIIQSPIIAFKIIEHFDLHPSRHRWIGKFREKFIKKELTC